ncbi:Prp19/Pso4-like-domain-containing protein [Lipomyces oligophaga]|uniref:Prp19/Pso4-like-domain-containing protein n=1 Tax=Lipomyces oligophaga TaxID=45792 RepID=UPI0034CDAB23
MICSISGQEAQDAVVSMKSGHVFERRLLQTYIAETNKDPITGEEMTIDDVITISTGSAVTSGTNPTALTARKPSQASIPALLQDFQNEWDRLVVEALRLRQELEKSRQDLSTALYYHDAAVRVVGRITEERDAAVSELNELQS